MPLLQFTTNTPITEHQARTLASDLSRAAAEVIGKPEDYVMVAILPETAMLMAGTIDPAALADVRSIGGLSGDVNRRLSERVCGLAQEHLGIPPERVYLNFTDVPRTHWGWNGSTFG